jgi:hypothetical protein
VSPKEKRKLARDHLLLAREESDDGRLGPATTMLLHALEAAIDALAAGEGIRRVRITGAAGRSLRPGTSAEFSLPMNPGSSER